MVWPKLSCKHTTVPLLGIDTPEFKLNHCIWPQSCQGQNAFGPGPIQDRLFICGSESTLITQDLSRESISSMSGHTNFPNSTFLRNLMTLLSCVSRTWPTNFFGQST